MGLFFFSIGRCMIILRDVKTFFYDYFFILLKSFCDNMGVLTVYFFIICKKNN